MSSLRIGLLRNDEFDGALYQNFGGYQELFTALLTTENFVPEITVYDMTAGQLPASPDQQQGWIIGGSRSSITEPEPWVAGLFRFIENLNAAQAPTVGVCFGHQAIAHALGGQVSRRAHWGVGLLPAEIKATEWWMDPLHEAPIISFCHTDEVTQLPTGGRTIAEADHSPFAMMAIDNHFLSMQPHPEFSAGFTHQLHEEWGHLFDETTRVQAAKSLAKNSDRSVIGSWIRTFLTRSV